MSYPQRRLPTLLRYLRAQLKSISEERRRGPRGRRRADRGDRQDRRSGIDRRRRPRGTRDRRRGPRRHLQRRRSIFRNTILIAAFAVFLCAPPLIQAAECLRAPVEIEFYGRAREARGFSLTRCDGSPHVDVLQDFSVHLRPRGVRRPLTTTDDDFVADGIRRFDEGLLTRLQAIADRFPEKKITIVSAFRPQARETSRHHHADALDLRVEGVHRAIVADFARTIPNTGVGFYPNSTFTHIDVRERSTFWVEVSQPDEPTRYADNELEDQILASALAALQPEVEPELDVPSDAETVFASAEIPGAPVNNTNPVEASDESGRAESSAVTAIDASNTAALIGAVVEQNLAPSALAPSIVASERAHALVANDEEVAEAIAGEETVPTEEALSTEEAPTEESAPTEEAPTEESAPTDGADAGVVDAGERDAGTDGGSHVDAEVDSAPAFDDEGIDWSLPN